MHFDVLFFQIVQSARLFSAIAKEEAAAPVGVAYSSMTIGVPKETYPLEK